MQVIAPKTVKALNDLEGKTVSVDLPNGGRRVRSARSCARRDQGNGYLEQIDGKLAGRNWFSDQYSVADPYLLVFYPWGVRRGYPMQELKTPRG